MRLARTACSASLGNSLDALSLKAFSERFGSLQGSPTGTYCEPGVPEVRLLSNIVENGEPIGLADAGQDWHTDMTYNEPVGFTNVLYAVKVPRRERQAARATQFANMHAAYDDLVARAEEPARRHDRDARLQQVLGGDAPAARQHAPGADAGAARQAAAVGASGLPDAPDHRAQGALLQSRLRDPHQRASRSGERRVFWQNCSSTSSSRSTSTRTSGPRATC